MTFGNVTTDPCFIFLGDGLATFGGDIAITGDAVVTGADLTLGSDAGTAAGAITLHDATAGTFTTTIKANATITPASYTLTLPAAAPASSMVLLSDPCGVLSWTGVISSPIPDDDPCALIIEDNSGGAFGDDYN